MSTSAIILMIIAMLVVWGGLAVAITFLRSRPEVDAWPTGGEDYHREDTAPVQRDT